MKQPTQEPVRWDVNKIRRKGSARITPADVKPLGQVTAPTHDAAIAAARARWPNEVDDKQVQGGFSIRVAK